MRRVHLKYCHCLGTEAGRDGESMHGGFAPLEIEVAQNNNSNVDRDVLGIGAEINVCAHITIIEIFVDFCHACISSGVDSRQ